MKEKADLLIVGAGPTGCVVAQQAAEAGLRSVIVDRRSHVGGLCHDYFHPSGILLHAYGPHYFRTNDPRLVDYLSRFTEWIPGNYRVKSQVDGRLYPFPINITTLEMFFGEPLNEETARSLLNDIREPIAEPANAEEYVCSQVGEQLYRAFYLGYTLKQWDCAPSELDPSVCGRVPVRLNRDDRYVEHEYQIMPKAGFTAMFERMIGHQLIDLRLETDYRDIRDHIQPRLATVYSGAIDEYFDYRLGRLPWRSLEFEFQEYPEPYRQPCVQINYPDANEYTRSVEIKHVTGQKHAHTVVCYEYPSATGDPYYPVPAPDARALYESYRKLAENEQREHRVYFAGRLGNYCYINSDQAIEGALALSGEILGARAC